VLKLHFSVPGLVLNMISFPTIIVLESSALNVAVSWGISVSQIPANGDDAYFDNRSVHYSILFLIMEWL